MFWIRQAPFGLILKRAPVSLSRLGGCAQQVAVGRSERCGFEQQPVLCTLDYLEG
jgi:hypothetical protein